MKSRSDSSLSAARIAIGYACIAILWIAFSDFAFTRLNLSPIFSTIKGTAFVVVTALLLYLTISRLIEAVQRTTRERDKTASLYRTVVEASEEGICLLDEFGRISFSNKRLATMLGTSVEKLQGSYIQDYLEGSPWLAQAARRAGMPQTYENELRTRSGANLTVLVSCTPLFDGRGNLRGSLAMFLDVTERKRLEAELRQSQKLEALGSFAGGITHDFNNLLSVVTGYGSILEKALPVGSEQRNAVREILGASQRGSLLIRQLMAFSRKQKVVPEVIDVCELVSRFGEVLPRIVGERICVSVQCDHSGSVCIGAGQIEQILLNLAANARDAMPDGGNLIVTTSQVELGASAANKEGIAAGKYVVISVSDTGEGIAPEHKSRIFEPFFTTKPQGAGTGLGLSTVYGIIVQGGGSIKCESIVGMGTTFTVYLPQTELSRATDEQPRDLPQTLSGTERVLLVEDEPALRALTKHILTTHGYEVTTAANGIEAIGLVHGGDGNFDLVLTDIMMPGMTGVDLARSLSREMPCTRVVFMSGYSELPQGMDGARVIQKPIAPDALLLELRAILCSDGQAERYRSLVLPKS